MTFHVLIASHACALPQNQSMFAMAARRRGWRVTMVIPANWRNEYGERMKATLVDGFDATLVTAPVIRNGSVPLHAYRMRAAMLVHQTRPDIVYSHNEPYALSTFQWCRAAVKNNIPFGFFSCQNLVKRYPTPFCQGESWVYRNSRFAFPITQSVDQVHRQKGYQGASTIMPLGYDPSQYFATRDVRQRHLFSGDVVHLAFIGRVVEEKGLITLTRALSSLRELPWRLTIVGSGPFESEVRRAMDRYEIADRVDWRGFVPHSEVAAFYENVDCLLLPSETRPNWKEQFGRVLVESMACGTPVIGSDSGEIPIIIGASGGGWVFRESDADSCADTIRQMIGNRMERSEKAERGHRYVQQNYAIPALADRFADAIEAAK